MLEQKINEIKYKLRQIDDFIARCRDRYERDIAIEDRDIAIRELHHLEEELRYRQQRQSNRTSYNTGYNNHQPNNYNSYGNQSGGGYGYGSYQRPVDEVASGGNRVKNERKPEPTREDRAPVVQNQQQSYYEEKQPMIVNNTSTVKYTLTSRYPYILSDGIKEVLMPVGATGVVNRMLCGYNIESSIGDKIDVVPTDEYTPIMVDTTYQHNIEELFSGKCVYRVNDIVLYNKALGNSTIPGYAVQETSYKDVVFRQGANQDNLIGSYFGIGTKLANIIDGRYTPAINYMVNLHSIDAILSGVRDYKEIIEADYSKVDVNLSKEILNLLSNIRFDVTANENDERTLKAYVTNVEIYNVPNLDTLIGDNEVCYLSEDSYRTLYKAFETIATDTKTDLLNVTTDKGMRYSVVISKHMKKSIIYRNHSVL